MIVHNLHIFGAAFGPTEAHSELVVDPDAVLASSVAFEGLQPITRRNAQILKPPRDFELPQLAACHGLDIRETLDPLALRKRLGVGALECRYHTSR